MANPENQGKTEKPTGKKLEDAHKKGDYPRSQEFTTAVGLLFAVLLFAMLIPWYGEKMKGVIYNYFSFPGYINLTQADIMNVFIKTSFFILKMLMPFMMLSIIVSVTVNIAQTNGKFQIVTENLKIKFDKINVFKSFFTGLKKTFGGIQTYFELVKSMVKVLVIAYIAWIVAKGDIADITQLPATSVHNILDRMGSLFFKVVFAIVIFMLMLSVVDYLWQRYQFTKKLKMSKDDIKDEHKQMEGDPKIKGKRRSLQMQQAMQRMMSDVPTADVIITNPTHYAVALKYDHGKMGSPKVVAKGADNIALKIRETGKENGVPVVENPPLARGLYSNVEVGSFVPAEFFKPVAEVLAFVFKLKGRRLG